MNIQESLTSFAMLGAGWIMWLLVALSILVFAIVLERFYVFFSSKDDVQGLRLAMRKSLRTGELSKARKTLEQSKSFAAAVVRSGIEVAEEGADVEAVEERLTAETNLAKIKMDRYLAFVGTVGNNAPFVGLLGTVIGIIRAFHELNESQGQVSTGLMAEIGEALVATAIGLLVAIPAVAFYNLFQRMIKARMVQMEALTRDLLEHLKSGNAGSASEAE